MARGKLLGVNPSHTPSSLAVLKAWPLPIDAKRYEPIHKALFEQALWHL
jgi:hypothetical protein